VGIPIAQALVPMLRRGYPDRTSTGAHAPAWATLRMRSSVYLYHVKAYKQH
jgi:hypothetical protein